MTAIQFDLTDPDSYQEYFLDICTRNKKLGENQFLFGDIEVGQNEASVWKGKKMWVWPTMRGKLTDFDNYFLKRDGSVWIGGAPKSKKFSDEQDCYNESEAIAKQVLSKMIKDKTQDKITTDFTSYILQRSDMMLGATKFIGCEIVFTWNDPGGLEYSDDDWTEE